MPEQIAPQETSQEKLKEREATKMEAKWYFVVGGDPDEIIIHPNGKRYKKEPTGYTEGEWFVFNDSANSKNGPGFDYCWPYIDDLKKLAGRQFAHDVSHADRLKEVLSEEPLYRLIPESEDHSKERKATPVEEKTDYMVGGDPKEIIIKEDGNKYKKIHVHGYTEREYFSHPGPGWDYCTKYVMALERLGNRRINMGNTDSYDYVLDFSDELLYRLVPIEEKTEE
ncbi:MAG: hypothetical protein WC242_02260 [Candidatus Paceibacterota bacterium]